MHTKGKSWKTYFIMNKLCINRLTICVLCMNCLLMGQRVCSVGLVFFNHLASFCVYVCVTKAPCKQKYKIEHLVLSLMRRNCRLVV